MSGFCRPAPAVVDGSERNPPGSAGVAQADTGITDCRKVLPRIVLREGVLDLGRGQI